MAECDKYLVMISALQDGELDTEQKAELYDHLENCASCRKVKEAFAAISSEMEELTPPPDQLFMGVMHKVAEQKKKDKPGIFNGTARFMLMAACAALIVFSGGRYLPGMGGAAPEMNDAAVFVEESRAEESAGAAVGGTEGGFDPGEQSPDMEFMTEDNANQEFGQGTEGESVSATPGQNVTVFVLGEDTRPLNNMEHSWTAESLTRELEELFAREELKLFEGMPTLQDIRSVQAEPFFAFAAEAADMELKELLGEISEEFPESVKVVGEPIITLCFAGDDQLNKSPSLFTLWEGEQGMICLMSTDEGDLIFLLNGDPAALMEYVSTIKEMPET